MKQFCLKLRSIFMLLCVCISVPLFTSCSEDEDENGLMGYWVNQDYESRWAEQIRGKVKYAEREPYSLKGTEKRFINNNTLNGVNVYAYYTKRDDAITTISVDGKTYYIVPEYERTITYVINDNKIVCTDGCVLTMADGLLYEDNTGTILTKLKKNNTNSENSLDNTNKLAKDIIGTWLNTNGIAMILSGISSGKEYIAQGNSWAIQNRLFEDCGNGNGYLRGYMINSTSIREFQLYVNKTEKSGRTTLKTFHFPDGTRYYLQMSCNDVGCSYWLLPVRENFFDTDCYDWFDVSYSEDGKIEYLKRYDWSTTHGYFQDINSLYDEMSQYSWIK